MVGQLINKIIMFFLWLCDGWIIITEVLRWPRTDEREIGLEGVWEVTERLHREKADP